MNPRRLRWGNQRALQLIKSNIEKPKDNLFFVKQRATGSAQAKYYLVEVDMDQLYPVTMIDYGVYRCWWYIRHHEVCTKLPIMECIFWTEIREMQQYGTLGKMLPVISLRVGDFLKKR